MSRKGIITVIDDDKVALKVTEQALVKAGFAVIVCTSGEEALRLFHNLHPRLILLDVVMPEISGIEVCRRIRLQLGREVPILMQTARDDADTIRQCLGAGANDYLIKGSAIGAMIDRIERWVERSIRIDAAHLARQDRALDVLAERAANNTASRRKTSDMLTSQNDDTVKQLSHLLAKAQAVAPGYGKSAEEKLYLLGYVTGVVQYFSAENEKLRNRFRAYLVAVLRETGILSSQEMQIMLSGWDELSRDLIFVAARKRGYRDCRHVRQWGPMYRLMGLAEFRLEMDKGRSSR